MVNYSSRFRVAQWLCKYFILRILPHLQQKCNSCCWSTVWEHKCITEPGEASLHSSLHQSMLNSSKKQSLGKTCSWSLIGTYDLHLHWFVGTQMLQNEHDSFTIFTGIHHNPNLVQSSKAAPQVIFLKEAQKIAKAYGILSQFDCTCTRLTLRLLIRV